MNLFEEINVEDFPKIEKSNYPDYFLENCKDADRLFKYKDFYIELILDDRIPFLSMINLGKPINIIPVTIPFIRDIISEYGKCSFQWCKNGTSSYLKKITKGFKILEYYTDEYDYYNMTICKKESDINNG